MSVRALFFDWDGVLSHDRFWSHLEPGSALAEEANLLATRLFSDHHLLRRWMVGKINAKEVLAAAGHEGFDILAALEHSCRQFSVDPGMRSLLADLRRLGLRYAAVATDNMDCFVSAWPAIDGAREFDELLCSSELGTLKQDPEGFFAAALSQLELEPEQALLIDDSAENCCRFEAWGGRAIRFRDRDQLIRQLEVHRQRTMLALG